MTPARRPAGMDDLLSVLASHVGETDEEFLAALDAYESARAGRRAAIEQQPMEHSS